MGKLESILKIVNQYNLDKHVLVDQINKEEPTVYLCGRSTAGKTTFLNALLGRENGEFFTSTDVSTKTEFYFKYSKTPKYQVNNEESQNLPITPSERKKLFRSFNDTNNSYTVFLPEQALKGRCLVDIPGVFDYNRTTSFTEKMFIEADTVLFLTPCMSRISSEEYNLLRKVNNSHIPIIVLFTMSDILNADEGVTQKTLDKHLSDRLKKEFEGISIKKSFAISAMSYFKNKDNHGIDILVNHLQENDKKYMTETDNGRLSIIISSYISQLNEYVIKLEESANNLKEFTEKEQGLWAKDQQRIIEDELEKTKRTITKKLEVFEKTCSEKIFLYPKDYFVTDNVSTKEQRVSEFTSFWKSFWSDIVDSYKNIIPYIPQLPSMSDIVLDDLKIDKDKTDELLDKIKGLSLFDEADNNSDKIEEIKKMMTVDDILKFGLNISNALIVFANYTFFRDVKTLLQDKKSEVKNQITKEKDRLFAEIESKKEDKIESLLGSDQTLIDLEEFKNALDSFNGIR